jgi:hypothetical protein
MMQSSIVTTGAAAVSLHRLPPEGAKSVLVACAGLLVLWAVGYTVGRLLRYAFACIRYDSRRTVTLTEDELRQVLKDAYRAFRATYPEARPSPLFKGLEDS